MMSRSGTAPRVRASHCLATLRTLRAAEPDAVAHVLRRLPAEVHHGLAAATTVDLVPAAWDVALVEAITLELGTPGTRALARATMLHSLRGPLLGNFLSGALRLFGSSPGRLFGWAGRVWGHVTMGCGDMRLDSGNDWAATLLLEGMPADLARPAYLDAVAGTLEAVFEVCEVAGQVAVVPLDGGARFEATWGKVGSGRPTT
jgi:hypothetical protein